MSGGKGGSQTSTQSIPEWVKEPAIRNLAQAEIAGKIGYMPYYGPDIAALAPQQEQAMRNTFGAQQAYGLIDPSVQFSTGMPRARTFDGGVRGYSSGDIFDQAVAELAARNPEQMARYNRFYEPAPDSGKKKLSAEEAIMRGVFGTSSDGQSYGDNTNPTSNAPFGILGFLTGGTPNQAPAPVVDMNTYSVDSGGPNGGYGGFSGAGDAATSASLGSDNTGGFYG